MPRQGSQTRERILLAALTLFGDKGIAATSLDQVAERAGVKRVTVYRYFNDKESLALRAFLHVEEVFVDSLEQLKRNPRLNLDDALNEIGERLSALPVGNAFARTEELHRLYPAAYTTLQSLRAATLNELFNQISVRIRKEGRMRPGLNRQLFQAVYWELTINVFDNPRLRSLGLSDVQLYRGVTDILLHGAVRD